MTLKANLGYLPPLPPPEHRRYDHCPQAQRSPAYFRRQVRRKAARAAAEQETTKAEQAEVIEELNLETEVSKVAEQATEEMDSKQEIAEEASQNFQCELCDFQSSWQNGLNVHMSRKHSKLDQLDGLDDENVEGEKYSGSKHYWMKGWLGGAYQSYLDAYDTIELCDLSENEKEVEKAKLLEARKTALGESYAYFPPWEKY